ncbi:hypothetical protein ACI1MP_05775 [Kitasatospora griseola]|uniref:hypothetical protein n=1 Tax=Kitasatospora griseola TaxID=2064 RepID=UPI0038556FE0
MPPLTGSESITEYPEPQAPLYEAAWAVVGAASRPALAVASTAAPAAIRLAVFVPRIMLSSLPLFAHLANGNEHVIRFESTQGCSGNAGGN